VNLTITERLLMCTYLKLILSFLEEGAEEYPTTPQRLLMTTTYTHTHTHILHDVLQEGAEVYPTTTQRLLMTTKIGLLSCYQV